MKQHWAVFCTLFVLAALALIPGSVAAHSRYESAVRRHEHIGQARPVKLTIYGKVPKHVEFDIVTLFKGSGPGNPNQYWSGSTITRICGRLNPNTRPCLGNGHIYKRQVSEGDFIYSFIVKWVIVYKHAGETVRYVFHLVDATRISPLRVLSASYRFSGSRSLARVSDPHASSGSPLDRQTSCFIRADAFLTTRDLGAFTQFHDETDHVAPFKHAARSNPPLVTEFRVSRMKGFITNLALHGKYRKENDRLARSLGYRIGKWPLVPLQGTIVRDHPGILEAYEAHYFWRSLKGARANMSWVRSAVALTPSSAAIVTPFPVHLGNDAFGAVTRPVNQDGLREWTVDVAVRVGKRVLRLQLRGGAALTSDGALTLMQMAMNHVAHACSTGR